MNTKRTNRATTSRATDGRKNLTTDDSIATYRETNHPMTSDKDMRSQQIMTNPIDDDRTLPREIPILAQKTPSKIGTLNIDVQTSRQGLGHWS